MPRTLGEILLSGMLVVGTAAHLAFGMAERRFEKYLDKYPSDLFSGEPDIDPRLRALLGANYRFFMERLQTQAPFRSFKAILFAKGCKAHECIIEEAILFIDLSDGKLHCAIRSETYPDKLKTFSENPSRFPSAALAYARDQ